MTSILQSPVANSQHIPHLTQNLVDTRTLEKGAVTPQETDPDLPVSFQESPAEAWVSRGLLQGQQQWMRQCVHRAFRRRSSLSSWPPWPDHSLVSGQTTGREYSPAHWQKIGLKIYWAWPHPSEQDPVSPSVSLSHQEASTPISLLSLLPERADRMKTTITEN